MAGRLTRAIVVGSEGQDGRILTEKLRAAGCDVLGIGRTRVISTDGTTQPPIDVSNAASVTRLVDDWNPGAVFYLPAVHRSSSEAVPENSQLLEQSVAVHVTGAVNFMHSLAETGRGTPFFYAASSLVFGTPDCEIQNEDTPLVPDSVYGVTKCAGLHACRYFRAARNLPASVGILYNHESPLRPRGFVSQRIVSGAVAISRRTEDHLIVGDLSARVDWGYAPDFVDAMVRIVELPGGDDFIVATGEAHTVKDFVETAFEHLGMDWRDHIREDPGLVQTRHSTRIGDSTRLRDRTGWRPSVTFREMVHVLVDSAREDNAS